MAATARITQAKSIATNNAFSSRGEAALRLAQSQLRKVRTIALAGFFAPPPLLLLGFWGTSRVDPDWMRNPVLLVIQQVSHLRLTVAVPEQDIGGIVAGARVEFKVPAFPERTYTGTVARVAHSLAPKTRTMPVELDVLNHDGSLSPGMYPSVKWPVRRSRPALLVPKTSVVTTAERTFVIRGRNGKAEWVDVKKGAADGDSIEVMGDLQPGDLVVRRATDEMRDGAPLPGR